MAFLLPEMRLVASGREVMGKYCFMASFCWPPSRDMEESERAESRGASLAALSPQEAAAIGAQADKAQPQAKAGAPQELDAGQLGRPG